VTAVFERGVNLCQRLADYFRSRPGEWIDGRDLFAVAGSYAWRSRVSDLRRPPFSFAIENRQERHRAPDGQRYTISFYRFVPKDEVGVVAGVRTDDATLDALIRDSDSEPFKFDPREAFGPAEGAPGSQPS
jgi:hypothetical protein